MFLICKDDDYEESFMRMKLSIMDIAMAIQVERDRVWSWTVALGVAANPIDYNILLKYVLVVSVENIIRQWV